MVQFEETCWPFTAQNVKETIPELQTSHNYGMSQTDVCFKKLQGRKC